MKQEIKQRLKENHQWLVENLEIDQLVHICFSKDVLNSCDRERILAERARPDKVLKFLRIFQTKRDEAYLQFLEALDDESVQQNHVRKRLEETPVSGSLSDSDDEQVLEQITREIFVLKQGAECSKEQILSTVKIQLWKKHKRELVFPADKIVDVICKVYPQAKQLKNKKSKKVVAVQNLAPKCESPQNSPRGFGDGASSSSDLGGPIPLKMVTPERVAATIQIHFEQEGLDSTLAEVLEDEDIDGQALADIYEDPEATLPSLYPSLTLGSRLKVKRAIKSTLEDIQKPVAVSCQAERTECVKLELYREFDTSPRPVDVYEKGFHLPEEQSRSGSLLNPVHRYSMIGVNDVGKLAEQAVQFAAACMNERTNGTIHFGVRSEFEGKNSSTNGEIVGFSVSKQQCQASITNEIYRAFYDDQREIALKCIRDPLFIPVVEKGAAAVQLFVIEVDVVPHCDAVAEEAFFLKIAGHKKPKLLRYVNGIPTVVTELDELYSFMEFKKKLAAVRRDAEMSCRKPTTNPDLHRKLHTLLTGGNDYNETDIFPVLLLSPCDDSASENFSFIRKLCPIAVFDFDPRVQGAEGQSRGLYNVTKSEFGQVSRPLTTDNFDRHSDENASSEHGDAIARLCDDIVNSSAPAWIFCNGYEPLGKEELPVTSWRSKRAQGFKEAVRFYEKQIPPEKALILIFLLSKNYEDLLVLLGALEEVFVKFPEQWVIIAESDKTAQRLKHEMLRRQYVDKQSLEERCVTGMPWSHFNQSMMNICGYSSITGCVLPSSSGTPVMLKERLKNELCDLEVLSMRECLDEVEDLNQKGRGRDILEMKKFYEGEFYRGKLVSWWNFHFSDQVLEREKTRELRQKVLNSLNGLNPEEDTAVPVVTLDHQPGAGGTTVAKHVLWQLKGDAGNSSIPAFRCCEVRQITDQTCEQISKFRSFEEPNSPIPPLVLVDNIDFEKVCHLRSQLNEKARREVWAGRNMQRIFCVLIVCRRMTSVSKRGRHSVTKDKTSVTLEHELKQKEVDWFQSKYIELEEKYEGGEDEVPPKLLISFNLMKENFSTAYMERTVDEFISDIHDYKERRLLKFIALINTYEIGVHPIHMSAFNAIMNPAPDARKSRSVLEQRHFSRGSTHWEVSLSKSLNILLNRTPKKFLGADSKAVRIINSHLSRAILGNLCHRESQKVSDVILELLHSEIFKTSNASQVQSNLMETLKGMLKSRAQIARGRKEMFAPIILAIGEEEDYEEAAHVLESGFDVFQDSKIAQQIARVYYLQLQNWKKAEKFAKEAMDMEPGNSYLCDTYGQVQKQQLMNMWKDCVENKEQLTGQKAREVMELAFKAITIFREEQRLNDSHVSSENNNAGFFSELRVIAILLDICQFLGPFTGKTGQRFLHEFLVSKYVPTDLWELLGEENIGRLKNLYHEYEKPLRRLEDELIQLKEDSAYQESPNYIHKPENVQNLVKLKVKLLVYFGEDNDELPRNVSQEEACEYRRRRVKQRGGASLHSIFELKVDSNANEKLTSMYKLIKQNVDSAFCSADDLRTLLNLTVALLSLTKNLRDPSFEDMVSWSLRLYELNRTFPVPHMEAHLYFVMFHWPTEWRKRKGLPLCNCSKLKEAIEKCQQAFLDNHPQTEHKASARRKPATLFFLGQGESFSEIAFQNEFRHLHGEEIWDKEEVKGRLKQLSGTLRYGGRKVSVSISTTDGSSTRLDIPTSLPIGDNTMWNETVYFYLGFCWSGPRAYAVNRDVVLGMYDHSAPVQTHASQESQYVVDVPPSTLEKMITEEAQFWLNYHEIKADLAEVEMDIKGCSNKVRKAELEKKRKSIKKAFDDLIQSRGSVLQGAD